MLQPPSIQKAIGDDDEASEVRLTQAIFDLLDEYARGAITAEAFRAISGQKVEVILQAMGLDEFNVALSALLQQQSAAVFMAKAATAVIADAPLEVVLNFAMLEDRAISWAATQAGRRVVQINQEMRATVQTLITESVRGQMTPQQTARRIREFIPLHDRFQRAVSKTYDRTLQQQLAAGKTAQQAEAAAQKASDRHAQRLTRVRAEAIARTEIMTASSVGRFEGWAEEIRNGWDDEDARKEWIAGLNPCPIHCDPINGEVVLWDKPFSNGAMMPPAHVGCRCTAVKLPSSVPLRAGSLPDRSKPRPDSADAPSRRKPTGAAPAQKRPTVTNQQGEQIIESKRDLNAGKITPDEHNQLVQDITT